LEREQNSNEKSNSTDFSEVRSWVYCPGCGNKLPKIKNIRCCVACGLNLVYVKERGEIPESQYATPVRYPTSVPYPSYYLEKLQDSELLETRNKRLWKTSVSIGLPLIAFVVMAFAAAFFYLLLRLFIYDLETTEPLFLILSTFVQFVLILFPVLYIGKYLKNPSFKNRFTLLGFTKGKLSRIGILKEIFMGLAFGIIAFFLAVIVLAAMEFIIQSLVNINIISDGGRVPPDDTELIISQANVFELILIVITVILVVATTEEILFRGFMQKGLVRTLGDKPGIIITAIVFGSIHLVGYILSYFLNIIDLASLTKILLLAFSQLLAISLFIGVIFHWKKENLIAVIIIHGVYDALAIIEIFFRLNWMKLFYHLCFSYAVCIKSDVVLIVFGLIFVIAVAIYFLLQKYDTQKSVDIDSVAKSKLE
jgi:membrane protease YdiL (CAAX protease family)